MSAATRLAGFAAVLVLVFAGAAVAGGAVDVDRSAPPPEEGHGMEMTADPIRGLAVSEHGLTLEQTYDGRELRFRITDRSGHTVRDFDVEHTKRMHLIVVRRDMTGFQHLHPRQDADGSWSVPLALREPGAYRVFADFSVGGEPRTLATDLAIDGDVRTTPLPAPTRTVRTDGLEVTMSDDLRFSITRDGRPVAVQDYLGAKGHLVALREGDLAFLHVHPDQNRLRFEATFPTAGRYRLFLQFKTTDGRLHTAAFTTEVAR
jgi:YD repeat-containing protein